MIFNPTKKNEIKMQLAKHTVHADSKKYYNKMPIQNDFIYVRKNFLAILSTKNRIQRTYADDMFFYTCCKCKSIYKSKTTVWKLDEILNEPISFFKWEIKNKIIVYKL